MKARRSGMLSGDRDGGLASQEWLGFEPDLFLPSQLHLRRAFSPEQRLLLAVAMDAYETLQKYDPRIGLPPTKEAGPFAYSRAWSWWADPDYPVEVPLRMVCEALNLDPCVLRAAVLRRFPAPAPIREAETVLAFVNSDLEVDDGQG